MALINCPDCNNQVSTSAVACPQCGAPIAEARQAQAAGSQLTTTQETSKKLKLHTLISVGLIVVGLMVLALSASNARINGGEPSQFPALMIVVGLVWYIATRFRIWWHHK